MKELRMMSSVELLRTKSEVIAELRPRGVVTTKNDPVGGYTEWLACNRLGLERQSNSKPGFDAIDDWLACNRLGLERQSNSKPGFDAIDDQRARYEIKGSASQRNSIQFTAIRNYAQRKFDFLIAVAFKEDYSVRFAVKIPYEQVPRFARYSQHTNSHAIVLTPQVVDAVGVEDITGLIRVESVEAP